jgi:uncharacterized membrane protein YdjX (TVP38/TMEM64 family)
VNPNPDTLESSSTTVPRISYRKLLLAAACIGGAFALFRLTPLHTYLQNIQQLKDALHQTGLWAPFIFFAGSTLLLAFGCPRLLLYGIAGLLFGFVKGLIIMQCAALAGSYGTFCIVRWGNLHLFSRYFFTHPIVQPLLNAHNIYTVFLLRQIPVTALIMNCLLGATAVTHTAFLAGSFLGYLPTGIIALLIGSGIGKDSSGIAWIQIVLAIGGSLLLVAVFAVRQYRLRSARHTYQSREETE